MNESATFPCPRCGAALPVDPTAPAVTCTYCRTAVPVPTAIRDPALAHAARVGAVQGRAVDAEKALGMYRASAAYQKDAWKLIAVMFGGVIGINALGSLLGPGAERVLSPLSMVAVYGSMIHFGYRYYRASQRAGGARAPLAVAASTCSRCGGPLTFEAGSARAVCHACQAVGLASRTIQIDLAAAAERRARQLDMERVRAERQMYRSGAGAQRFARVYLLASLALPVVLLVGGLLIGGVVEVVSGAIDGRSSDVRQGISMLLMGGVLGSVVFGVALVIHAKAVMPARAAEAALRAVAARLGGRVVVGGTTAALDWLDGHWWGPAPYEVMMAQQELARATLETAVAGLPALVVVVSPGLFGEPVGKRLHVIVAAPGARGLQAAPAAAAEIARYGFEVKVSEDGVALARDAAGPEVTSEAVLGWLLTEAAALARA